MEWVASILKIIADWEEKKLTMIFLMRLNKTFLATHGNILLMKSFPSLNEIYSLIIQE